MNIIKKFLSIFIFSLIISTSSCFAYDELKLVPLADVVYINASLEYPFISKVFDSNFKKLQQYDVILSITSTKAGNCFNIKDVDKFMKLKKEKLSVKFLREGHMCTEVIFPDELRLCKIDFVIGSLGTITGIDEKGNYVGLAHNFKLNKSILKLAQSPIYETSYIQEKKSQEGDVGYLSTDSTNQKLGTLNTVNEFGIKGNYNNFNYKKEDALGISNPKLGIAYIFCKTPVTNELKMHKIKITSLEEDVACIEVLDDNLINLRGGLVQGMSGSPIIQNNKIVGGLRSIKISNPKIGYISNINTMLNNK